MQEAIQFLMIGLKVILKLFRIGQLDPLKLMQKVHDLIQFSRSVCKNKKEMKSFVPL